MFQVDHHAKPFFGAITLARSLSLSSPFVSPFLLPPGDKGQHMLPLGPRPRPVPLAHRSAFGRFPPGCKREVTK